VSKIGRQKKDFTLIFNKIVWRQYETYISTIQEKKSQQTRIQIQNGIKKR